MCVCIALSSFFISIKSVQQQCNAQLLWMCAYVDHYIVLVTSMKRDRTSAPAACLFLMPFSSEARQNMTELFHKQPAGTGNKTYWQSGSVCMSLRLFPAHCEQITFIHSDRCWSNLRTQSSFIFGSNKYYTNLKLLISPHESFEAHS